MSDRDQSWRTYEEVATFLLNEMANEFGLKHVEGKQSIAGITSGTSWEIDAKGICSNHEGFVLIEIRRYTTSRISQEATAAIAYRITDTGASGGIIVSPLGLQEGARRVAAAEGIHSVQLNEGSTTQEYILRFLNKVMLSLASDSLSFAVPQLMVGTLETTIDPMGKARA